MSSIRTIEAVIEPGGQVRLAQPVFVDEARRALVLVLDEEPAPDARETALLSEQALSAEWNLPEEDAAWKHLQPGR